MHKTSLTPTRTFAIFLVVAGTLGAGVAWKRSRPRPATQPQEAAEESAPSRAALEDELATLRRRLAKLERDDAARGQAAGAGLQAGAEEAARAAEHKAAIAKLKKYYTPELEAKMFTSYFDGLDGIRRAEGVDQAWARGVESLLRASLHGEGAVATLAARSVECGRTLCRIELQSSDPVQQRVALSELLQKLGEQLPQASVHVPPGTNHMTAYLAREGTNLPAMDSPERLVADLP
jgi:hypothetical protein